MFIILTEAQANAVRGEITPGWALEPAVLTGGAYALPADVLDNPHYAPAHDALRALPQRDVADEEFVQAMP